MTEQESGGTVVPDRVGQAAAGTLDSQRQVVMAAEVLGQAAQRRLECRRPARCQNAENMLDSLACHQLIAGSLEQRCQLLLAGGTEPVAASPDIQVRHAANTNC